MSASFAKFQKLGRALMLPIAVLPVAGLLLRLGQPVHWNDNWGDCDDHLPLGAGNIDWSSIFDACRAWKTASVTLEMQELGSLQRSLSFLERQGVLPRSERFRSTTASVLTPP